MQAHGWEGMKFTDKMKFTGRKYVPRLCSVGYLQHNTRGIYHWYYPTKDFCKFSTTFVPRTRNFCKFCTTFIPVPVTSLSTVLPPVPQIPGVREKHFCTCRELLWVLQARATIPGTSVSSVTSHAITRNFCDFYKTVSQYPGYGYNTTITMPGDPGIHSDLTPRAHYALQYNVMSRQSNTPNTEPQHVL